MTDDERKVIEDNLTTEADAIRKEQKACYRAEEELMYRKMVLRQRNEKHSEKVSDYLNTLPFMGDFR